MIRIPKQNMSSEMPAGEAEYSAVVKTCRLGRNRWGESALLVQLKLTGADGHEILKYYCDVPLPIAPVDDDGDPILDKKGQPRDTPNGTKLKAFVASCGQKLHYGTDEEGNECLDLAPEDFVGAECRILTAKERTWETGSAVDVARWLAPDTESAPAPKATKAGKGGGKRSTR
jgi:hypothetical protein